MRAEYLNPYYILSALCSFASLWLTEVLGRDLPPLCCGIFTRGDNPTLQETREDWRRHRCLFSGSVVVVG